jgi:hypothetical protein
MVTLNYVQGFAKLYVINNEADGFVPISFKTQIVSGSTITDLQTHLATNPDIYQLFNRLNTFPANSASVYNNEPEWNAIRLPDRYTTWTVVNCNSIGEDGVPIGTISTGTNQSIIG